MFEPEELYYDYVPDEVTVKISDIIKEELNNRLGSNLEELNKLRQLDKEQRNRIYELQQKIQEEYDKKLKTALLEKQKEVQRKIFHGFTMRDKVFFIDYKYEYTPCLTCQKTGKLKAKNVNNEELEVECPHCNGGGKKSKWTAYVRQGEICQVDFKTWYDESEKCIESKFYIQSNKENREQVKYGNIFWTEEEAIKACEQINNK